MIIIRSNNEKKITYTFVVKIRHVRLEEQSSKQSSYVGSVWGQEDDAERAPHVYEHFVRPGLGRLERDQVAEKQSPHDPQRRPKGEVLCPATSLRVQAKRRDPLIDGGRDCSDVQADKDGNP